MKDEEVEKASEKVEHYVLLYIGYAVQCFLITWFIVETFMRPTLILWPSPETVWNGQFPVIARILVVWELIQPFSS